VVIQRGIAVADRLNSVAGGLADIWTTSHDDLEVVVAQTNQAASDLASVNEKIRQGTNAGLNVNELMDQRDTLVRTLSDLVGGVAVPGDGGTISVSVNGVTLVGGSTAQKFTLGGAGSIANAKTNPPALMWGTTVVPVDSGAAAGLLGVTSSDLPTLAAKVDAVAVALRDSVNAVHAGGFTLGGAAGTAFFTGTNALSFAVAVSQPSDLAVASAAGVINGGNALRLGDLVDDVKSAAVLGAAGPAELWRNLSTGLGVQVQSLENAQTVQASVLSTADSAVESDAGVSIDEEMTNMLLYQRAYQASSRVITTVDEMLDTLINRTGVVGR
jgi:flagellar hook-associated protein 1 FlgK